MNKKIVVGLSFLIFFTILGVAVFSLINPNTVVAPLQKASQALKTQQQPSPTPFPFQELTIPYLASRSYESTLGDREVYREASTYTSYLTHYTSDNLRINALLTIPKGEQPEGGFPAVVFVHGYIPPTAYQTTQKYESFIEYLASRGIVVLKIDLRGHGDSEGEASGAYFSGDYIIDVLHAYEALRTAEFVHPEKVGLWGHSMAGNVIMRAVAAHKTIPKAVIVAGAVYTYDDFEELRISDDSYRPPEQTSERQRKRTELYDLYGQYSPDSWFWQMVPATNYLDGVETAIQVHHAVNDDVVSIEYSRGLEETLADTNIAFELFEYQSGGHNLTGSAFSAAMQRTSGFFSSY